MAAEDPQSSIEAHLAKGDFSEAATLAIDSYGAEIYGFVLSQTNTEQDARDWFDYVWPLYRDGGYSAHKRAIRRWWHRLRLEELERARARAPRPTSGRSSRPATPESREGVKLLVSAPAEL